MNAVEQQRAEMAALMTRYAAASEDDRPAIGAEILATHRKHIKDTSDWLVSIMDESVRYEAADAFYEQDEEIEQVAWSFIGGKVYKLHFLGGQPALYTIDGEPA